MGQNLGTKQNDLEAEVEDKLWLQKYYETAENFCLNDVDKEVLKSKFNRVFDI